MELFGGINQYIDVAQIALYLFWLFFAGLILYLLQEGKREGFPLDTEREGMKFGVFFPPMPAPKTFLLPDGDTKTVPDGKADRREVKGTPILADYDAPLDPTGDPLVDGLGPAAWAERADVPDRNMEGHPRLRPMRVATGFSIVDGDPDPRGMSVMAADKMIVGTIKDCWVDQTESLIRYLEIDLGEDHGARLVPMTLSRINAGAHRVEIQSIIGRQFANVPVTADPEQVTLLEEDKISAYYAGGHFYATPDRREPFL